MPQKFTEIVCAGHVHYDGALYRGDQGYEEIPSIIVSSPVDAAAEGWRQTSDRMFTPHPNEKVWICPECVDRLKEEIDDRRQDAFSLAKTVLELTLERISQMQVDAKMRYETNVYDIEFEYQAELEQLDSQEVADNELQLIVLKNRERKDAGTEGSEP